MLPDQRNLKGGSSPQSQSVVSMHLCGGVSHQKRTVRSVPQFLINLLPGDVAPVPFSVL